MTNYLNQLLCFCLIFLLATNSQADQINDFQVKIYLTKQGLILEESIDLTFTSNQKYDGIYRVYAGNKFLRNPQIIQASVNGKAVKQDSELLLNKVFGVYYGDTFLDSGNYHYSFKYNFAEGLTSVKDNLELLSYSLNSPYWNIPIKNLSAQVIFPAGMQKNLIKHHAYSQKKDKKDFNSSHSYLREKNGQIMIDFQNNKELSPEEEFYRRRAF